MSDTGWKNFPGGMFPGWKMRTMTSMDLAHLSEEDKLFHEKMKRRAEQWKTGPGKELWAKVEQALEEMRRLSSEDRHQVRFFDSAADSVTRIDAEFVAKALGAEIVSPKHQR